MSLRAIHPPTSRGFTLVEVTLSLGIFAFAIIAIMGMLPVGLQTAQDAYRQNDARAVMSAATAAIRGARSKSGAANPTWQFGDWLSDQQAPQLNPTEVWVGQEPYELMFTILDTGEIRDGSAQGGAPAGKLRVKITPPSSKIDPVRAEISYAWPSAAAWDSSNKKWNNSAGSVSTVIYAQLPQS